MLKKLFITTAAAAVVSVPLAGAAWATPSQPNKPPGQGTTGPGIPHELGAYADSVGLNPNGTGKPIPPGQEINIAKNAAPPGTNTPTAVGEFVNGVYAIQGVQTNFDSLPPGSAVKSFTPGCQSGNTATSPNGAAGPGVCH